MAKQSLEVYVNRSVEEGLTLEQIQREVAQTYCLRVLKTFGNNVCAASEFIGIHRNTFHRYLQRAGVELPKKGKRVRRHSTEMSVRPLQLSS